jgi:hypothetical protein
LGFEKILVRFKGLVSFLLTFFFHFYALCKPSKVARFVLLSSQSSGEEKWQNYVLGLPMIREKKKKKKKSREIYNIHVCILNTGYCPAT